MGIVDREVVINGWEIAIDEVEELIIKVKTRVESVLINFKCGITD